MTSSSKNWISKNVDFSFDPKSNAKGSKGSVSVGFNFTEFKIRCRIMAIALITLLLPLELAPYITATGRSRYLSFLITDSANSLILIASLLKIRSSLKERKLPKVKFTNISNPIKHSLLNICCKDTKKTPKTRFHEKISQKKNDITTLQFIR